MCWYTEAGLSTVSQGDCGLCVETRLALRQMQKGLALFVCVCVKERQREEHRQEKECILMCILQLDASLLIISLVNIEGNNL